VLVLPDGHVVDESLDIMHWALGRNDPAGWLRQVDEALIATIDGPFKGHLDHAKYPDRHGEDAAVHYNAAADLLGLIETRLASSDHPTCDGFSFTDAAILPFVRQFAGINHDAFENLPIPRLQGWLNRFLASVLFDAAMPRLLPWKEGDPEIRFPCSSGASIAASW
jgi:glutathione S-transferase